MKSQILVALGENGLQHAATALNAGLAANDRVKYVVSLLLIALSHAQRPDQAAATLKQERLACGFDDAELDAAVSGAREIGEACRIPRAARLMGRIGDDMRLMAAPVLAAHEPRYADRPETLLAARPNIKDNLIDPDAVSAMMQDRIRVVLAGHFRHEEQQLLRRAAEHAGLVFELAALVRDGVQDEATSPGERARWAQRFEHDADQIVADTRDAVRRRPDTRCSCRCSKLPTPRQMRWRMRRSC